MGGATGTWTTYGESVTSPISNETRKTIEVESPKLLFLLFWVKGHFGAPLYTEAPKTRLQNIKNSDWYNENKHEVHCPDIEDISEIVDIIPRYIEKFGGKSKVKIKEVSIHSHSGQDGPVGSVEQPKHFAFDLSVNHGCAYQMTMEGWKSIDFNWSKYCPRFIIYGCDSALEHPPEDSKSQKLKQNFAKVISTQENFRDVQVWGQSTKSVPSYYPEYRNTSLGRDVPSMSRKPALIWRMGTTYQIAAHLGGGLRATIRGDIPAEPMNCYKNGERILSVHQGYFNDHRRKDIGFW